MRFISASLIGALALASIACDLSTVEESVAILEAGRRVEAVRGKLQRLDQHCSAAAWMDPPGDAAKWKVPSEALERYVRIRQRISASLKAVAAARNANIAGGRDPRWADDSWTQWTALGELADVLADEGSCPREFEALLQIVEWRFLRREEAWILSLTRQESQDRRLAEAAAQRLIPQSPTSSATARNEGSQVQGLIDDAVREANLGLQTIEELERRAGERTALEAGTRSLLEAQRERLVALDGAEVADLCRLLPVNSTFSNIWSD